MFDFKTCVYLQVGSNGNGRHYQDQTDRKNEQTMTQDKDLIFAQHTFFCFSATAQVAHLVLPDTQANASQNQKSQANQSPPTTPNYF